jgi:hypothetical protein
MVAVLMLPAMLYLMRLARKGSPRLAVSGGVLAFVRWLAGFRACPGHRGGGCSFVLATAKLPAMTSESRHISEWIDRPADEVYDYASDPANLPHWAPGLGSSVENVDERWFVESSMGRVAFAFAPHNEYGILRSRRHVAVG